MKLLILCNRIPYPPKDGGSLAMYQLIEGYANAGMEVELLAINTRKHFLSETDYAPLQALAKVHAIPLDTDVKPWDAFLNLFTHKSYNIERFHDGKVHKYLKALLSQEEYDVIQLESIFMAPYLSTIRKNSNAPVVLRAHNVEHQIWERMAERENRPLKKWYLGLLARRLEKYECSLWNAFDGLLPISAQDSEWFEKAGFNVPKKVTPVGINTAKFNAQPTEPEPNSLFHIGSLDWMPNEEALEWFIEDIWPLIHSKNPEANFHIAGRHMPEWIESLKEPGITIAGEVPDAKAFMEDKGVMVVPLLSGSGIRVKILEGMALGKCIVTTSLGVQGIHCTHGQHLFIADNPEDFAAQVVECLKSPELLRQIGQNAQTFVCTHYDNQAITQQVIDFFEKTIIRLS